MVHVTNSNHIICSWNSGIEEWQFVTHDGRVDNGPLGVILVVN